MEWRDHGIVLGTRGFGETSVILDVLTRDHGRHSGVVKGGISRKYRPILQPGSVLDVTWRARLSDHMGSFSVDLVKSRSIAMQDRFSLAGLSAVAALLQRVLPERDPMPDLYDQTNALLDILSVPQAFAYGYFHWELALLGHLGYGLDLSCCAVTGSTQDLIYVSPKSGRAVSRHGAGEWADRLLPLPDVAKGLVHMPKHTLEGLTLTQYFLENKVAINLGITHLPSARERLLDQMSKLADAQ